ncbi:MAG TPA: hypothetical protein VFY90_08710 [Tepidiformaceae bacterium]|nr:hypothetical protein [Candidatus Eisenbacteria bacterium]HEX6031501.1 hypothetical protein [Tepidiformaceae bacterium]
MDPRNPDFERHVRESFSKQRIMTTLVAAMRATIMAIEGRPRIAG